MNIINLNRARHWPGHYVPPSSTTFPSHCCPKPNPCPVPDCPVVPWQPMIPDPRCICNKALLLYIPPGQHIHCPVHPQHVIYGPMVTW